jgi:hypothetical protein
MNERTVVNKASNAIFVGDVGSNFSFALAEPLPEQKRQLC